jgi:hypothetical protein
LDGQSIANDFAQMMQEKREDFPTRRRRQRKQPDLETGTEREVRERERETKKEVKGKEIGCGE